jgi:hypothetical protein
MVAITTSAATPITPPTMAPTGALLDLDDAELPWVVVVI